MGAPFSLVPLKIKHCCETPHLGSFCTLHHQLCQAPRPSFPSSHLTCDQPTDFIPLASARLGFPSWHRIDATPFRSFLRTSIFVNRWSVHWGKELPRQQHQT